MNRLISTRILLELIRKRGIFKTEAAIDTKIIQDFLIELLYAKRDGVEITTDKFRINKKVI